MIDDSSTLPGPIDTGRGRLSTFDQLAEIPEEEIWRLKQKSARTRQTHQLDVQHFIRTLCVTTPTNCARSTQRRRSPGSAAGARSSAPRSPTIRRRLAALSSLRKYLVRHDHAPQSRRRCSQLPSSSLASAEGPQPASMKSAHSADPYARCNSPASRAFFIANDRQRELDWNPRSLNGENSIDRWVLGIREGVCIEAPGPSNRELGPADREQGRRMIGGQTLLRLGPDSANPGSNLGSPASLTPCVPQFERAGDLRQKMPCFPEVCGLREKRRVRREQQRATLLRQRQEYLCRAFSHSPNPMRIET